MSSTRAEKYVTFFVPTDLHKRTLLRSYWERITNDNEAKKRIPALVASMHTLTFKGIWNWRDKEADAVFTRVLKKSQYEVIIDII